MPIFFQHVVDADTRFGIWKIEETEQFFLSNVPIQPQVSHPHKRLQHLAGRFLLRFLYPDFPYELIRIADTRKPFLANEAFHFSISHCGDYAAAIVSKKKRVGIDIEIPSPKVERIKNKFLSEMELIQCTRELPTIDYRLLTLLWSAKEAVFKWYGDGGVDFSEHIQLRTKRDSNQTIHCLFTKTHTELLINYNLFDHLVCAWVVS
jgi:phosphopantetheinyl transferase